MNNIISNPSTRGMSMGKAKKIFIFLLFIIAVFLVNIFLTRTNQKIVDERGDMKKISLTLGGSEFVVWIADTETHRSRGLSSVKLLKENQAMLFVFENPGNYNFWMKDMLIPIDIAWFDSEKKLIHFESDVSPLTYPKLFSSNSPALYVLETKAGEITSVGIKIGDVMEFDI